MELVVEAALRFDGNETEKRDWLDTIFAAVDKHYGYIHAFKRAIDTTAGLMPEAFLNRILRELKNNNVGGCFLSTIADCDSHLSPRSMWMC